MTSSIWGHIRISFALQSNRLKTYQWTRFLSLKPVGDQLSTGSLIFFLSFPPSPHCPRCILFVCLPSFPRGCLLLLLPLRNELGHLKHSDESFELDFICDISRLIITVGTFFNWMVRVCIEIIWTNKARHQWGVASNRFTADHEVLQVDSLLGGLLSWLCLLFGVSPCCRDQGCTYHIW